MVNYLGFIPFFFSFTTDLMHIEFLPDDLTASWSLSRFWVTQKLLPALFRSWEKKQKTRISFFKKRSHKQSHFEININYRILSLDSNPFSTQLGCYGIDFLFFIFPFRLFASWEVKFNYLHGISFFPSHYLFCLCTAFYFQLFKHH